VTRALRPRLKSGLVPLWRDQQTVQIGLDPRRAVVVGGIGAQAASALRALDGRRRREEIVSGAGPSADALLSILDARLLLDDADDPLPAAVRNLDEDARGRCGPELAALALLHTAPGAATALFEARRRRRVLLLGGGRVGAAAAHLLASSGIGRVTVVDDARVGVADPCPGGVSPADVGLRRSAAVEALCVRALPPALASGPPDVAVWCQDGPAPLEAAVWEPLLTAGTALLPVTIRELTAVVGPMMLPDALPVTGCPACMDLHRGDRDPSWPILHRQLAQAGRGAPGTATAALVAAAAGTATGQILELLDRRALGRDPTSAPDPIGTAGASVELSLPGWAWRRRWWGAHPDCTCTPRTREQAGGTMMGR